MAEADEEDVDKAVKAARKAFDEGPWPRMWAASLLLCCGLDLCDKQRC